jgi:hypothetical protein
VCVGIRSSVGGNFDLSHCNMLMYCVPKNLGIGLEITLCNFWEQEHVPPFECLVGAVWDTHLRSIATGGAILRAVGQAVVGGWEGGGSLVRRERGTCVRFFSGPHFFLLMLPLFGIAHSA